ncbi:MAG TPA: CCA tRNA nucleotidyltransferase [Stellaceae bacterium]|nr:CCA tRNA nucleotidyltransferase [Stellaceae bacterium]
MNRIAPPWLTEPAVQRLLAALAAAGIEARFVGGCVRDALLGIDTAALGGDIDLATPARPEAVIAALAKARIKAVPTGLAHGTVTAVTAPRQFEITTLRRDVETDGRHARVAFDAGWEEDAARRDFTINAIYLGADGTLYDPVGGRADLAARRVRFVGDPATRIAEDVLRLLRYYRFEARFGGGAGDPASRAACRDAAALLPTLSAERVSHELLRLLAAPDPIRAVRISREDGVLAAFLPEATRIDRLAALVPLSGDALLRLAALIEVDKAAATALAARLRLSNAERTRLAGLASPWPLEPVAEPKAQRMALYRLGRERYRDLVLLCAAEGRLAPGRLRELLEFAETWPIPPFPLGGDDVTGLGIAPGPRVGRLLGAVRRWWEAGDFTASRDDCLAKLRELAAQP